MHVRHKHTTIPDTNVITVSSFLHFLLFNMSLSMSESDAFVEILLSLIATKIISMTLKKLRIQRFSQIFLLQMGDWNLPGADLKTFSSR